MNKKCKYCGTENEDEFSRTESSRCRTCRRIEARVWRYGMEWEASEHIEEVTHCEICNSEFKGKGKHLDHNHDSGMIRGVICPPCNLFMSRVDGDSETIDRLLKYLNESDHGII